MRKSMTARVIFAVFLCLALAACAPAQGNPPAAALPTQSSAAVIVPTATTAASPTVSATQTVTPTPAATPDFPPEGYGPSAFPAGVNPLTGLKVDPASLARRPLLIKVENLPRNHRPQFGLNRADLVFEYYTEEGTTRFAALFYGQDSPQVAPIRSARWFDMHLVRMYKAVFVYGGAYTRLWDQLVSSDFGKRLVVEGLNSCPALCRYDPNGDNLLSASTGEMAAYLQQRGIDNSPQNANLDGMFFQQQIPPTGEPGVQLYARYSGAIYNRWDYDAQAGVYLRFADTQDDLSRTNEVYVPLTDRIDGAQISASNVVVILAPHIHPDPNASTEVVDINLTGSGPAYLFRDGHVFAVQWQRAEIESVLRLADVYGQPVALRPGRTWFEVMGQSSKVQPGDAWRFEHVYP